jgi:hypothetical protein
MCYELLLADGFAQRLPLLDGSARKRRRIRVWRANFGRTLPPGSAASLGNNLVPEPATWLLTSLATLAFGGSWRRRLYDTASLHQAGSAARLCAPIAERM